MQTLAHPVSGVTIQGVRLAPGGKIQEGDKYDSTCGAWEEAGNAAGLTIHPRCQTIWVRQPGVLSENAWTLLGYLALQPWGTRTCIGKRRSGGLYVIPSPDFNWDGRVGVGQVQHPECVQELVDHGYLALGQFEANNVMSDYATVWTGHQNRVYTLTEAGKQKGEEIISQ